MDTTIRKPITWPIQIQLNHKIIRKYQKKSIIWRIQIQLTQPITWSLITLRKPITWLTKIQHNQRHVHLIL